MMERSLVVLAWLALAPVAVAQEPVAPSPAEALPAAAPTEAGPSPVEPPALAPASGARAAERSPLYVTARFGKFRPDGGDTATELLDDGYSLGLALAYRFAPHWAVELGAGQHRAESGTLTAYDPMYGTIRLDLSMEVIPITASLRLLLEEKSIVLSGVVGVGYHFVTYDASLGGGGPYTGGMTEKKEGFGFHAGAAVDVFVSEHVALGGEIRRNWAKATLLGETSEIGGMAFEGRITYRP